MTGRIDSAKVHFSEKDGSATMRAQRPNFARKGHLWVNHVQNNLHERCKREVIDAIEARGRAEGLENLPRGMCA